MTYDSKVIHLDFTEHPEVEFRSQMVDVFKRYFATQTVEMMLDALRQAIIEEEIGFFTFEEALKNYVEERSGYRIITKKDFEDLKEKIIAEIYRNT